jgi:hypothetical protein
VKKRVLANMPGVRALVARRGEEEVRFREVADHLVDFAARNQRMAEVLDSFGAYLAEVEQVDHDHRAAEGSAGG